MWHNLPLSALEVVCSRYLSYIYPLFPILTMFPGSSNKVLYSSVSLPLQSKRESVSHSIGSNSLQPHRLQHARPPCPSPTSGVYSDSCPLSRWCHPAISSSVVPFSSCLHSFPASGSFKISQFFTSGSQSIGVSALASVLPVNIQDWFPLGLTS